MVHSKGERIKGARSVLSFGRGCKGALGQGQQACGGRSGLVLFAFHSLATELRCYNVRRRGRSPARSAPVRLYGELPLHLSGILDRPGELSGRTRRAVAEDREAA